MRVLHLGMDIGSVSVNTVILNSHGEILRDDYRRTKGQPLETAFTVFNEFLQEFPLEQIRSIALTGTAGKIVADLLKIPFVNEIIAQARAIDRYHPNVRTIIEMGGEDSKLILLSAEEGGHLVIQDFAMNTLCAAGTGSFLDQQAHRLGLTIEEFSQLSLKSETPPRIAGRCTVFAKTDMIHLQQEATPDYDIIAGLCFAVARNLKSNIAKGKNIVKPVSFQGGVAANQGVRRAFSEVLELKEGELVIPEHFFSMGAIGASLIVQEDPAALNQFQGLKPLKDYLRTESTEAKRLDALSLRDDYIQPFFTGQAPVPAPGEKIEAYLGVDVGSISTNVVVIDQEMRVLSEQYLMTAGRPLEAIRQGLAAAGKEVGHRVIIKGAATTGSGRYLTGDFIGADIVRNEITAQATAAAAIDPLVDTIFEIGGQDSKYISLENGAIVDFMMNKVCAAGTGSFLEEQADKLGISIKGEFGALALESESPVRLGERCTVFMESDLVHHQQKGLDKKDLVAGLSYSIVENYLNKVVEDRRVGKRIFYQGATAFNKGIVAAFEKIVGKPITVPEHNDVTGAIGVAILAMRERTWETSRFKGFDLARVQYEISSFECKGCPNQCEVKKVSIEGEKPLFYGSRCDKYDLDTKKNINLSMPDLFAEREALMEGRPEDLNPGGKRGKIGIPRTMFFRELLPFFRTFFAGLGFEVVISGVTNKSVIHQGVESMAAETCLPIKVANGHILDLIQQGVDRIFLPSIVDLKSNNPDYQLGVVCPYAQTLSYTVHSSINFKDKGVQVISPVLYFGRGEKTLKKGLMTLSRSLGINPFLISGAMKKALAAQETFYQKLLQRGEEVLSALGPEDIAMMVVSRPYNGFDPGINLNIPKKLRDLGILAVPMDFFPLDQKSETEESKYHYWRFGQKILGAAEILRNNPRLYGIYITNFSCGPDSFILHFFRDVLKGKPYLEIEIDEHSADAGVVTRLEAFLDSLKNSKAANLTTVKKRTGSRILSGNHRKIFIPPMTDHTLAVAAAFQACGVEAEVLPDSDQETLIWGRKLTSGKECYPCILTTGDMAKLVLRKNFDPQHAAFFMPSGTGPCRFGQYHRFHRLVLDELGFPQVPIYAPDQSETFYQELGMVGGSDFTRLGWQGVVAVDCLEKKLRETRPYEINKGETEQVYQTCLTKISETIASRGDIVKTLKEANQALNAVPVENPGSKPVIGMVGEIYTRANKFANENVILEVEALGGEAWLPPIAEWILYTNYTSIWRAIRLKKFSNLLELLLTHRIQTKLEHELEHTFKGSLRNYGEPSIRTTLKNAHPYLHPSFEGEAILSLGKAKDYWSKGAFGLINIMPFTCMPGTIVNALLKRFREDHRNIPFLNLSYDGQEQTNTRTRLEAFMYQVQQVQTRKEKGR
ncbi:MAG: CoA activase [Deltaproteobacteria bacterium RBG_13_43_22]|nr:MAG: CoA activase [Deltaproteobacteria bacterium RBG_13_43_22]